ncbi:asparagine synthetase B, partial [Paenibacillus sepulcri]|nr:asparagine synthetase B [Paenibacillus sepulcri]
MAESWDAFISELHQLIADPAAAEFLNTEQLADSLGRIGTEPRPELAFDFNYRILMRGLIFYRFIKKQT